MKKILIGLGVFIALLFILLIAARLTGTLLYYNIPTPANEPTIRTGEKVFTSNLRKVFPYKFIVFTNEVSDSINASYMPDFKSGSIYLYRLCGTEGDILEMKNGVLWVNNKKFDEGLNLNTQYKTTIKSYSLIEEEDLEGPDRFIEITKDSAIVTFDNYLLEKYKSKIDLVPFIISDTANGCFKWYDKFSTWTADNFGPLKIPADRYFVLGDNRHNALDSRYTGFIKKKNIKGVVLNK